MQSLEQRVVDLQCEITTWKDMDRVKMSEMDQLKAGIGEERRRFHTRFVVGMGWVCV
jgi:hypothetical protein